jgi:hypothetical protein
MSTLAHQGGIPAPGLSRRTIAVLVGLAVVAVVAYGLTSQSGTTASVGTGTAAIGQRSPGDIQRFETDGFAESFSPEAMPSRLGAAALATTAAKSEAAWDSRIEFLSQRYAVQSQLAESATDKANDAWQSRVEYMNEKAAAQMDVPPELVK